MSRSLNNYKNYVAKARAEKRKERMEALGKCHTRKDGVIQCPTVICEGFGFNYEFLGGFDDQ